jgi:Rrf2 family protein
MEIPMYLNKSTQNAVVIISELKASPVPVRIEDISKKHKLSIEFLWQIAKKLKNAGLVHAIRGPRGGYCLRQANITLLDVVKVFPTAKGKAIATDPWLEEKVITAITQIQIV